MISLRNKTVLGLSEVCGYYLGFRATRKPTRSAALRSECAWPCVFGLRVREGPYPSSVSLFGQAGLEVTSRHLAIHPSGFPLVLPGPY